MTSADRQRALAERLVLTRAELIVRFEQMRIEIDATRASMGLPPKRWTR